mgnify:CR=1 FL=1
MVFTGSELFQTNVKSLIIVYLQADEDEAEDDAQGKMNDDNPDNAINRFEWMEAVVRIAVERYPTVPTKVRPALASEHVLR